MSALARLVSDHATIAGSLPASVVTRDDRQAALGVVSALGLPGGREENWRYASLRPLDELRFVPQLTNDAAAIEQARSLLPEPLAGFDRFV
ncbi:MAG: hypothetical protein KIT78_06070, partial [Steroidobacteraceae bacterium]|nr:hypothetical protein [Steroidobacteraceae bacterium]